MKTRRFSLSFLIFACLLLVSCASTAFQPDDWHVATNLSDLHGTWVSSQGEYTYPFIIDGRKYLRYSWNKTDDTALWKNFAAKNKMDLEEAWSKRFALAPLVYSTDQKKVCIPDSDVNGIETGRKYFLTNEKIFSRVELLIPERLVSINLAFFVLRRDSRALKEQNILYLASDKFPDIEADDALYFRMKDVNE